jgi:hypothetical protein
MIQRRTSGLISDIAKEQARSAPLKDWTRDDLLAAIRKVSGGLPFAVPLGDDEDDDTAWIALDTATDDQLRFYLAYNYARAHLNVAIDDDVEEKLRAGEIEIINTAADGTRTFRTVHTPKKQGGV